MENGTRYFVEYATTTEDDEKEITVIRTAEFNSILSMAKWARVLPSRCRIVNKFKTETETLNIFDESEFDVEVSREPRHVQEF